MMELALESRRTRDLNIVGLLLSTFHFCPSSPFLQISLFTRLADTINTGSSLNRKKSLLPSFQFEKCQERTLLSHFIGTDLDHTSIFWTFHCHKGEGSWSHSVHAASGREGAMPQRSGHCWAFVYN